MAESRGGQGQGPGVEEDKINQREYRVDRAIDKGRKPRYASGSGSVVRS